MKKANALLVILTAFLFVSCLSGKQDYSPPYNYPVKEKSVVIEKPKDVVWKALMAKVANSFFVINNLDKESGFINLSYSGPPCNYIDCGWITSEVSNARGKRTYTFEGCSEYQEYELADSSKNFLGGVKRIMKLEGRINILVQEEEPNRTRISTNVRYLVTKGVNLWSQTDNRKDSASDTINFDTGGSAVFAGTTGRSTCQPNHKLEEDVLKMVKGD
jgi:hypothetical protein